MIIGPLRSQKETQRVVKKEEQPAEKEDFQRLCISVIPMLCREVFAGTWCTLVNAARIEIRNLTKTNSIIHACTHKGVQIQPGVFV